MSPSMFNQTEMHYNIIKNYSSSPLCSSMIKIIAWNSFNDYSNSFRVIDQSISIISRRQLLHLLGNDSALMAKEIHEILRKALNNLRLQWNFDDVYITGEFLKLILIFYIFSVWLSVWLTASIILRSCKDCKRNFQELPTKHQNPVKLNNTTGYLKKKSNYLSYSLK